MDFLVHIIRNRNNQAIQKKIIFLACVIVVCLVFVLFYSSDTTNKTHRSRRRSSRNGPRVKYLDNNEDPIIYSRSDFLNRTQKPSEDVICFLVASFAGDIRLVYDPYPKLRVKIAQLDERFKDNCSTDVIVFHTGYPFRGDMTAIMDSTRREVQFVNIDHIFYQFSPGFEPHIRDPTWSQKGKWNYHQMCYFWFKQVFQLKIMQRYRYMMRLDDDSQILGNWPNIFEIMEKNQAIYLANKKEADVEYLLPGLTLVRNLTAAYIAQNRIAVRNPAMLADVFNHSVEVPHYWSNFEVIDLAFMQRPEVIDFIDAVDDSRGIFLYRWGDAPLRYITLALFANATEILHRQTLGLIYCHPC